MLNAATMTEEEISREIVTLLAGHLKQDPEGWNADTLLTEIGLDSFDFVEFVFLVEDNFGIEIDYNANDMAKHFSTVGSVAAAIRMVALKGGKASQAVGVQTPQAAAPAPDAQGAVGLA